MSRRVVITGLGTVNPLGNNVETTWDNVKKGVCGIDEITRIDTTVSYTHLRAHET